MSHSAISAETLNQLVEQLRQHWPELLAAYHFGSTANGQANTSSDIDLAILVPGKANALDLWQFAQTLATHVGRDVDLVDLRAASTVMQHQIVTAGERLWARDEQAALYECFILSEKTALDEARSGLLQDIAQRGRVYGG